MNKVVKSKEIKVCPNCNTTSHSDEEYCPNCGAQIDDKAVVCVHCGVAQPSLNPQPSAASELNAKWLTVLLLCIFLGGLGIHRFYVGKTGSGIVQLLTAGGCGIWAVIDLIMILTGNFEDSEGNKIVAK